MTAVVEDVTAGSEIRIVTWIGGISVWPPGNVVTYDGDGNELHFLN